MSVRDYNKQVARRQRIGSATLVVGVDIGSAFNAVGFMNKEGKVLGSYPKMPNSREGFEEFVKITEGLEAKHGLSDVIIGLEPTGHYWRKFAYFAKGKGYEVRFVRTTALKHHRELDESSSAKSDQQEALTLTNITREGKYIDTVIEDGRMRHLRILVKVREKIQKRNVSAKNSLHAALDDYFPELKRIFWSMHSRGLWVLLERCPFPEDVVTFKVSALKEMIGRASRRRAEASQKATALYQAAKESIGLRQIGSADRYRLKMCLEEVKRTELTIKDIKRHPSSGVSVVYTWYRTYLSRCLLRGIRESFILSGCPAGRQICGI
jgi:transposase